MMEDDDEHDMHHAPSFVPHQKVWAREHDGIYYEAVVRKTMWQERDWKFLVHYAGWNARWDKWLSKADLMPDTPENRERMRQEKSVLAAHEKQQVIPATTPNTDRKRKKLRETKAVLSNKQPRRSSSKARRGPSLEAYCELPFTLKTIMMDDRARIQRMGFDSPHGYDQPPRTNWRPAREVHHLPSIVPIKTVLAHFVQWKVKKDATQEATARAFSQDVAALFDAALPVCLLYQQERAQYLSTRSSLGTTKRLSDIYGCEHLLRLFVRLPVLMKKEDEGLGPQLAELIMLLQKNRQSCCKAKYREPSSEELHQWEKTLQQENAPPEAFGMDDG